MDKNYCPECQAFLPGDNHKPMCFLGKVGRLPKLEVKPTADKRFGLFVNNILIGDSKNQFDADHAKAMLEKALNL